MLGVSALVSGLLVGGYFPREVSTKGDGAELVSVLHLGSRLGEEASGCHLPDRGCQHAPIHSAGLHRSTAVETPRLPSCQGSAGGTSPGSLLRYVGLCHGQDSGG